MVDWNDGKPNARFWVLRLLHDNFHSGDKLVEIEPIRASAPNHPYVYSMAFASTDGKRKVLLVNKRDRTFNVSIAGASGGTEEVVDQTTAFQPPAFHKLEGDTIKLTAYAVVAVTLP